MGSWRNVGALRRLQALDKAWVHDVTLGGRGCVSGLLMKAGFMTLRALCNLVGSFVAIWRTRSDWGLGHLPVLELDFEPPLLPGCMVVLFTVQPPAFPRSQLRYG